MERGRGRVRGGGGGYRGGGGYSGGDRGGQGHGGGYSGGDRGGQGHGGGYYGGDRGGRGGGFHGGRGGGGGFSGDRGGRGGGGFQGGRGGGFQGGRGGRFSGNREPEPQGPPPSEALVPKRACRNEWQQGQQGSPVDLIANLYKLTTSGIVLYHYDVAIRFAKPSERGGDMSSKMKELSVEPKSADDMKKDEREERFIRDFSYDIIKQFVKKNPNYFGASPVNYVFDGSKNFYSLNRVFNSGQSSMAPFEGSLMISLNGRRKTFVVKFTLTDGDGLDTSMVEAYYQNQTNVISPEVVTVYEIILNNLLQGTFVRNKRAFFDTQERGSQSQSVPFINFIPGFTNSIRRAQFGLALNVHLRTGSFLSLRLKTMEQFVGLILDDRDWQKSQLTADKIARINRAVKSLKVFTDHNPKLLKIVYKVGEVTNKTPGEFTFMHNDKETTTVLEYFKQKYNRTINPNLPLVKMSGKKDNFVPMDMVKLVESQYVDTSKMNEVQNELLLKSTHKPLIYFDKTGKIVQKVKQVLENNPVFQLEASSQPVAFKGRVLPSAKVSDHLMFMTPSSGNCVLFTFDYRVPINRAKEITQSLAKTAKQYRMNLNFVDVQEVKFGRDVKSSMEVLYKNLKKFDISLVFFIVPSDGKDLYETMKHFGNCRNGIITQGMKGEKVANEPRGYFQNILKKVNAKMNGQNTRFTDTNWGKGALEFSQTMVVGVDVVHPGATENVFSSIAAAVGSLDKDVSKFGTSLRVQEKQGMQEEVTKIDQMVTELLEQYRKANQGYPQRLVIFRDGVSEGQFQMVEQRELAKIREACKKLVKGVKITLFVVQKRHKIRFIRKVGVEDKKGRMDYNVASGTVVDTTIVDPEYRDFYLNSHYSPMGTSKPSRYIMIANELNLTTDEVQRMCFYMCHHCVRTEKIISIPVPVRYADLLAYMCKIHLQAVNDTGSFPEYRQRVKEQVTVEEKIILGLNQAIKVNDALKTRLFYV